MALCLVTQDKALNFSYRKLYPGDIGVSGLSSLGEGDNEKGE